MNVGVSTVFTVTANVAAVAHWPADGVKVYTPECWLSTVAGLQVPVIPLIELVGSAGTAAPAQMVRTPPKLNDGVTFGTTVTVNVVIVAHWPPAGVKVYVLEF